MVLDALFYTTIVLVIIHFGTSLIAGFLKWLDDAEGQMLRNVLGGRLSWVTAPLFVERKKTPKRWLYPWFGVEVFSKEGWTKGGHWNIRSDEARFFAGYLWSVLVYGIAIGGAGLLTVLSGGAIATICAILALIAGVFLARNYVRCRKAVKKIAGKTAA